MENLKIVALLLAATAAAWAQPGARTFEQRCSICHGGDANGGGRAPSIVAFVRYHTDAELSELITAGIAEKGMPSFSVSADELRELLAELRTLSGSSPDMATGGFTGEGLKPKSGRKAGFGPTSATLKLRDGSEISGTIVNEDDFSAQLLTADGKFHFFSLDGEFYREKPIEPKRDWTSYNGAYSGNRYSSLEQINRGNIGRLALEWLSPLPGVPRIEATPVVSNGVMYVTGWNEIHALDATTGREMWMYRQPPTPGLVSDAGKGANRGAAISGERVFMVTDNAHVLAFDRRNGAKLWDAVMGDIKDGYSATGAPLVVDDLVIAGVAGGEEGARGLIDAFKTSTGERVWRFYTVPKRGEKASETWIGNALEHGCGATWLTGSYDPDLDLIYWQTGNPCPDFNGDERKGDNLYTDSVVALSAKTGELKWHYQFTPHDLHDWDATQPMLLLDLEWQGAPRRVIAHADRNGFFFVLDRTNGELLLAEPFVKVNWATGYGKDGRPILTDKFESSTSGTLTCPASSGGANWPSSAWNPITKLFYVRAVDWCAIYTKQDDPLVDGRWFGGAAPNQPGAQSFIRALDVPTGRKVWEYPLSANGKGGVLSTAGGLVFVAAAQGSFVALDAGSGKDLWHVSLGQDWQASPMTYMVGGKQYIAIPGPGGIFTFALRD